VNRQAISAAGFTPAAPLNTGWITSHRNSGDRGNLLMILPAAGTQVLPVVIVEGHDAALIQDGSSLVYVGAGLPVNLTIYVALQLELYPSVAAFERLEEP
jgi:hypothetical protein